MKNSQSNFLRPLSGLMLACLMASLTACALPPSAPTFAIPDPALYAEPIPVPTPKAGKLTNSAISQWTMELIEALGLANADRAALAAWVNKLKGNGTNGN